MLLLIDNFDSFTYNLVQAFQILRVEVKVVTKEMPFRETLSLNPSHVVIGPGPGAPKNTPLSKEWISFCEKNHIPLLGVCLGHQALAEFYGGIVERATKPIHGKTSSIFHDQEGVFHGLSQGFQATRYHSLIVRESSFPKQLKITAKSESREIMGISHISLPLYGVQFHPEAILTTEGEMILKNFIDTPSFSL